MSIPRQWRLLFGVIIIVISLSGSLSAQNAWDHQPYQQWTLSDLQQILNDSPWAQTQSRGIYNIPPSLSPGTDVRSGKVTLRLSSALPIRQALVRLQQLKAKYDKMSESQKKAFDARTNTLLECAECVDHYIVSVGPIIKGFVLDLRITPLAKLKLYIRIADEHGEKRELVDFVPPKTQSGEMVLLFSRFNERGEPLLIPTSQKLIISFDPAIFGSSSVTITKFEFDVPKMILNGKVSF